MLSKLNNKRKLQKGFTIIEVLIVLAIAGLILVVVLVAIPQLQRNQRNNARQSIAARITTEVSNYAGNNQGTIPLANNTVNVAGNFGNYPLTNTFAARYLANIDLRDPSTNTQMTIAVGTGATTTTIAAANYEYRTGARCDVDGAAVAGNARAFVIRMGLEGGITYCLDNE